MTEHPLEQFDPHIGDDNDTTSTQPVEKRESFFKALSSSKSNASFENRPNNSQPLNISAPQQTSELAPDGSLVDDISIIDGHSAVSSTLGDDSLSPSSTNNKHFSDAVLENVTKPTFARVIPRFQERFERTDQLVYCCTLLLQEQLPLSPSEHETAFSKAVLEWLVEIKKDPVERDRLQWLASRMVEKFVQDAMKDSTEIAEIVALGPILQLESYRKLLSSFLKEFGETYLLD
ncbi:hypothetical protein BGZ88_001814, partial [Linnemannia elongata]